MGSLRSAPTTPATRLAPLSRPALAGLAMGAALTLAGYDSTYLPPPAAIQEKVDCLATVPGWAELPASTPPANLSGSVPEGFIPVDVITCSQDYSEAGGVPQALVRQQHLEGDYTALLAALAKPSARGGSGPCTADMEIVPGLWLVNAAGEAVSATWPTDGCGKTGGRPDTAKALAGLRKGPVEVLLVPGAGPAPQPGPTLVPVTSMPQGAVP